MACVNSLIPSFSLQEVLVLNRGSYLFSKRCSFRDSFYAMQSTFDLVLLRSSRCQEPEFSLLWDLLLSDVRFFMWYTLSLKQGHPNLQQS